jgi:hypothetical protein
MKTVEIPKNCNKCRYGYAYDMSVDDWTTYCYITGNIQDECDMSFENGSLRQDRCPLPNLTDAQFRKGELNRKIHIEKVKIINRYRTARKRSIRLRNLARMKKSANNK